MRIPHRMKAWRLVRVGGRRFAAAMRMVDWFPFLGYGAVLAGDASIPLALEAEVLRGAAGDHHVAHPPSMNGPARVGS